MLLAGLAWRNLWRRPQRTLLSLVSIVIVSAILVFMLSFQIGVYETMKESSLRILDGYAQVQPMGYADDPGLERTIERPDALIRAALGVEGVTTAAPRVASFAILANGARSYGAAVVGVDPTSEPRVSAIARMIAAGRYLRPGDDGAAVIGDVLARNLNLGVGGQVTLLGQARDGSVAADVLTVVGIYHSGVSDLDRGIMETPLARAQADFAMDGRASVIALSGPSLDAVSAAVPGVAALARAQGLTVLDWGALEPAMRDAIALKYATSMLFYLTLVVVVAFIILNTLLMSVLERTREFGMLLAVGMRPGQIGAMVWIELLALALVGCALGLLLGAGITLWFERQGVDYGSMGKVLAQFGLPSRLYPTLTPLSALLGPGALLAAICLGGIAPYLRVSQLTPALAMRAA